MEIRISDKEFKSLSSKEQKTLSDVYLKILNQRELNKKKYFREYMQKYRLIIIQLYIQKIVYNITIMTEAQKKAIYIYRLKQKYIKVLKQRIKLEKELNDNGV